MATALVGTWRLLYTSSKSVAFHQGLTGLANTLPGAQFSGLVQQLAREGQMLDCEYTEELGSLNVSITGDWEVRLAVAAAAAAGTAAAAAHRSLLVKLSVWVPCGDRLASAAACTALCLGHRPLVLTHICEGTATN